jgi:hypothetical protein
MHSRNWIVPVSLILLAGCSREEVSDAAREVERGMEAVVEESKRLASLSREKLGEEMRKAVDELEVQVEALKAKGRELSDEGVEALKELKTRLAQLRDEKLSREKLAEVREKLMSAYRELKRALLEER